MRKETGHGSLNRYMFEHFTPQWLSPAWNSVRQFTPQWQTLKLSETVHNPMGLWNSVRQFTIQWQTLELSETLHTPVAESGLELSETLHTPMAESGLDLSETLQETCRILREIKLNLSVPGST